MFVRVARAEGATGSLDDAAKLFEQQIMPPMRQTPGFKGAAMLANATTGVAISATYWEDEAALKASEEAMAKLRGQAVQTVGARSGRPPRTSRQARRRWPEPAPRAARRWAGTR